MEYVSTRGSAPALDFEGATLAGLAADGGLYVPREWPRFSLDEIAAMRGLPYPELAARVIAEAFDYLDAPPTRVTGKDVPMPYASNLEKLALPSADEVIATVNAVTYRG